MDGYIRLYKKIRQWKWYKDSNTKSVFIDLLLDANYEDTKVGNIIVKRGQCLTSLQKIQEHTGLTFQAIRTALEKLESNKEINKQTTSRYSIISINKYDDYQESNKQNNNIKNNNNNKYIYINNNIQEKERNNKERKIEIPDIDWLNMSEDEFYEV